MFGAFKICFISWTCEFSSYTRNASDHQESDLIILEKRAGYSVMTNRTLARMVRSDENIIGWLLAVKKLGQLNCKIGLLDSCCKVFWGKLF